MAIARLPPSTTRLLGSSVVITSAVSLVKELIDNGIDAGATSIEVLISQNTVDKVQVKDNGHGISFQDFDMLGRPAHTSKLRTFEELQETCRESLGFRGEALASANSFATVKITTKTSQDPVGTLVLLRPRIGGTEREQPVAATIGTTVQVLNLFENLPVLKQMTMKESRKSLSSIKRLLEAYAFAIPNLRLSFKVIGEPNQTWSYSPRPSANPREAGMQMFGSSVMAQCIEVASSVKWKNIETSSGATQVTLNALLPGSKCQLALVKDKGAYISVDSRPLSSCKGIGKKLVQIFKASLTRSLGADQLARRTKGSFLSLTITCSAGSYDPNITPLKDDVLFGDEEAILDCFRNLCDQVYNPETEPARRDEISSESNSQIEATATARSPNIIRGERVHTETQGKQTQNAPQEPEEDSSVDDEDLIGTLDDVELIRKSFEPNESSSGATHPIEDGVQQGAGSRQGTAEQPETTSNQTVAVAMRTLVKVNLARKDSSTSDQCGTEGLVSVQVTPRRTTSPALTPSASRPDRRDIAPCSRQETIRQYFRSKEDQPIEIALDETATSDSLHNQDESNLCETSAQQTRRQPLRELTSSILNISQEEDEEEAHVQSASQGSVGTFSSPERDILRLSHAPRGSIDLSLARERPGEPTVRHGSGTVTPLRGYLEPGAGQRRGRGIPYSPSLGNRRYRQVSSNLSSVPSNESSYSHRPSLSGHQLSERDQSAVRVGRGRQMDARTGSNDLRQPIAFNRNDLRREANHPRMGHNRSFDRRGWNQRPGNPSHQDNGEEPHGNMKFSDQGSSTQSSNMLEAYFGTLDKATAPEKPRQDAQWHMHQAILMRTPPPSDERNKMDEDNIVDCNQAQKRARTSLETRLSKRRCSRPQNEISTREEHDPRRYYMKGRSLRTLSGKPKRLPSIMLPLEKVPPNQETQWLVATVGNGLKGLRALRGEYIAVEQEHHLEENNSPLQFKDMNEALSVEGQLKKAVNVWLEGNTETVVDYTVQSVAKGKWTI